ncbi:hypothetical protein PAXINDRAFT_21727 [Paxillus involutus ATCC 200175]|uniref:Uncharacterized protein n=1 Tax=Paxillus involutus ATCC 200175 TaxID=664439 RepID=A0A0C9T0J5_PAXIN|nr:hypothetical protein PAXINDRAFT_21727 [Paxillus involutus ATCC 200175]
MLAISNDTVRVSCYLSTTHRQLTLLFHSQHMDDGGKNVAETVESEGVDTALQRRPSESSMLRNFLEVAPWGSALADETCANFFKNDSSDVLGPGKKRCHATWQGSHRGTDFLITSPFVPVLRWCPVTPGCSPYEFRVRMTGLVGGGQGADIRQASAGYWRKRIPSTSIR